MTPPSPLQPSEDSPPPAPSLLAGYALVLLGFVVTLTVTFALVSKNQNLQPVDIASYGAGALFLMAGFVGSLVAINVVRYADPELKKAVIKYSVIGMISGVLGVAINAMSTSVIDVDRCIGEFRFQLDEPGTQDIEGLAEECMGLLEELEKLHQ